MFIGREKELSQLNVELSAWKHKTVVLVYGKRRVGKSTLIKEAAKKFDGVVVNHMCVTSTFEGNMELIYQSVSEAIGLPNIRFGSLSEMMDYLGMIDKKVLLIIDEYPYLKQTKKKNEVDSYMQAVIEKLPENVKLILCGSYIAMMKELLEEENPLFGRFSLIQHIRDFDYLDAAKFYPELSVRDRVAFYAVFGGSPYVLENLDTRMTLKENIERFLLPETSLIRSHIENVVLKEIQKTFDVSLSFGQLSRFRVEQNYFIFIFIGFITRPISKGESITMKVNVIRGGEYVEEEAKCTANNDITPKDGEQAKVDFDCKVENIEKV